jgi:hypothetical protein
MGRIDAWWIVATMKDAQPLRDRTDTQFVTHPMSLESISTNLELAVASFMSAADPEPARISNLDL